MKRNWILLVLVVFAAATMQAQTTSADSSDPGVFCQAYFTAEMKKDTLPPSGGVAYAFRSFSSGDIISYNWDFGDGNVSTEANPSHIYLDSGDSVTICLNITTSGGCTSGYCEMLVVGWVPENCETAFSVETLESQPPVYKFIPVEPEGEATYWWDFGDGTYSDEKTPLHKYEFSGNYTVCLGVGTAKGCYASICQNLQAVGMSNECKAYWVAYGSIGTDPLREDSLSGPLDQIFGFQDMSRGFIDSWHWTFGDGTTSDQQNPVHGYASPGVYRVCLEISTTDGCEDTHCDSIFFDQVPYCSLTGTVEDFTGLDGCGLLIRLDNGELIEPAEMVPDFELKNGQRVRLSYTELTDAASICMAGKIARIDCIEEMNTGHCQAAFHYFALPWISSWPPLYQFNDLSAGEVTERFWDFGDGTVTSEPAPVHRYAYSGYYTVCLTVITADGCKSSSCLSGYFEGEANQTGICSSFIKLSTDIVLNGDLCNGNASATLVDKDGNELPVSEYVWSTGETGSSISNLCPAITYSVMLTDTTGCIVSGSFAFGGVVITPDSLFGYWNYEQADNKFLFNIPVYSDSIYCEWDFGNGDVASGASVSHTFEEEGPQSVALRVYDNQGNLLMTQQIPVTAGSPTPVDKKSAGDLAIYPVPADRQLFIMATEAFREDTWVDILSLTGQKISSVKGIRSGDRTLEIHIEHLPAGVYMGRLISKEGIPATFRFTK